MSVSDSTPSGTVAYRLSGDVDGEPRVFHLSGVETTIGSHPENALVLRVAGVSRRHAVLGRNDDESLWVEDRGSKNGTWINGRRIERAPLAPGDELSLGSVALVLEWTFPGDDRLALSFGTPEPETFAWARETEALDEESAAFSPLLQWLESFVDALGTGRPTRFVDALDLLMDRFGSTAAALSTWRPGEEPTLLAVTGDVAEIREDLENHGSVLEEARDRALEHRTWQLERIGGGPVVGLEPLTDDEVMILVLTGDFPERAGCGPLLRFLTRLITRLGPISAAPVVERRPPAGTGLIFPDGHVAGRSPEMESLYREMETVAGGSYPILILGETGSGKEMISRALHASSSRGEEPFVAVNCAAIPADLIEAEMFGVARGAATGVAPRKGCFSRADGGTLFLDEIGELHPELQAKLLRALEYGEVQPVGGTALEVDVRVVSATNVDLERRIRDGSFRADLYYRLAASVIQVPPLRRRRDDLPVLIQHFVGRFARELGVRPRGVTQRAFDLLLDYPWPGNVRELQHELRRAVQKVAPGQALDSLLLSEKLQEKRRSEEEAPESGSEEGEREQSLVLKERVAEVEKRVVAEALKQAGGNKTLAAQILQISRNTLATKTALYGLDA